MPTYIDQLQRSITLQQPPQRIVSLVPSQTELLHHWGLGERVVGITKFCIHPDHWYRSKTRVGGTKTVDFERIQALQPDLIIGNKEENTQAEIQALTQDYPVWMSDINTLEQAFEMMTLLGALLGVPQKAQTLVRQLQTDFGALTPDPNRPKVAYFIWRKPWMVAARHTFIDDLLQRAGWVNALADFTRYPILTEAALQAADPDLLLLSSEPYPFREKHLAELQALCPQAQVYLVDGELFSWYGSRLLETAEYIKNLQQKFAP